MPNDENNRSKIVFQSENLEFCEKLEETISILKFLNTSAYLSFTYSNEIVDEEAYITGYNSVFKMTLNELENILYKEEEIDND
ncbi:hypothetical protein L5F32_05140 [Aliarcobacter butzleri]|uniref:hypothetical protein n=1 Tax=Aliarcobacter butzleri TaxID=28197 RepID=UPI001ED9CA29|nr:hypothetical protein [Aliarcobacter butzleri]MCG3651655.1 hypothetical protein [Aliarcobacter butzleri]